MAKKEQKKEEKNLDTTPVLKSVTIPKYQSDYLKKEKISLSNFVRLAIQKEFFDK